jgi:cytochrome oxidase Cu insertion factor (SCO1/SenC/PrrC family)
MNRRASAFVCCVLSLLVRRQLDAGVEEVEPQRGRAMPPINWVDDTGRTRRLSDLAGFPVVLLPVYTRCRTACIANADQLKKALSDSAADPTQFRVLLFSFDPTDTPAMLRAYRQRENLPLAWSVGAASTSDVNRLLDAIGFQAAKAGSEFMHTNMVVFLDSNLHIAKWIYGTDYSSRDVDAALKVAAGGNDWIGEHAQWLYAAALFGASMLCVILINYLLQLKRGPDAAV